MNTMDNAKVMETLEKCAIFNYFEKLVNVETHKVALFSVFPFTGAANLSDPQHFFLINDPVKFTSLNCGRFDN